jgi:hypothetical protein
MRDLAVIIASWNTAALLSDCLDSVDRSLPAAPGQVIVVDNGSTDGSADMVADRFPWATLVRNAGNSGYARANNQGLALCAAPLVLFLNSDTVVPQGALAALTGYMEAHPKVGACSPRLVVLDGRPQPFAFGEDPSPGYLFRRGFASLALRRSLHDWGSADDQEVDWVTGACLLARTAAVRDVGGLDEGMFMYFEDNDLCLRLRQRGWHVRFYPAVTVTHLGGRSLAQNPAARREYYRSLQRFYRRHYGWQARVGLAILLPLYRLMVPR